MTGVDRGELLDLLHPLERGRPRTRAVVERAPGRRDGPVDVLGRGLRRLADGLLGVRRDHRDTLAARRRLPPTTDEKLFVYKGFHTGHRPVAQLRSLLLLT